MINTTNPSVEARQLQLLELGDQGAQLAGVLEQRSVVGDLVVAQHARDGLPVDLSRPEGIGPVELGWICLAPAVLLPAPVGLDRDRVPVG